MSFHRSFQHQARYNVLTPAFLLAALALSTPAWAQQVVPIGVQEVDIVLSEDQSLINYGEISSDQTPYAVQSNYDIDFIENYGSIEGEDNAVNVSGNVNRFLNGSNASIESENYSAVYIGDGVGQFDNRGDINSNGTIAAYGINIDGYVGIFENSGSITAESHAIFIEDSIGIFRNSRYIESSDQSAVFIGEDVDSFENLRSGEIVSDNEPAVRIDGNAKQFLNQGAIDADGDWAITLGSVVALGDETGTFRNEGSIEGFTGGIKVVGGVESFENTEDGELISIEGNAVEIGGNVGSFFNAGEISGYQDAVKIGGSVGEFINSAPGTISGVAAAGVYIGEGVKNFTNGGSISGAYGVYVNDNGDGESVTGRFVNTRTITGTLDTNDVPTDGVYFDGSVNDFANSGTIKGGDRGVEFNRDVKTFLNADGTIEGIIGVDVGGAVENFTNAGTITGLSSSGVALVDVTNFHNWGTLKGVQRGVTINGVANSFTNHAGGVISSGGHGVFVLQQAESFENHGEIHGGTGNGIRFVAGVDSFANSGEITSTGSFAVTASDAIEKFTNSGNIKSNGNRAINLNVVVGEFDNSGTISGVAGQAGLYIRDVTGKFINSGTIESGTGIEIGTAGQTLINRGAIEGTDGIAVRYAGDGNTLVIQSGATFIGGVDFGDVGAANNLFDFSNYRGSLVLDVLDNSLAQGDVLAGLNLYYQTPTKVVITSASSARHSGQPVADVVSGVSNLLAAPLAETAALTDDQAFGYAPGRRLTEAELATGSALSRPDAGFRAWGSALGGASYLPDTDADLSSLYGGLVAGAHAAVSADTTIGLLGGYARSTTNIAAGTHTITADTGILGVYGETRLDMAHLSYALLGGLSANASEREVSAGDDLSTASANFGGWWLAPEVSASIPVLSNSDGELRVGARVGYIGGGFAGYTETGSTADLTVSAQTFGLLNAAIEVSGDKVLGMTEHGDIVASASLGLFSQTNVGGSDVSVSLPDFANADLGTLSAATGTTYGVKLGGSLSVPVAHNVDLSAGANGLIRNDGFVSAGANVKLSGSF